ncbi:YceI family protein [Xanthomonas arboricola]|uniref:YceI family protein n=1 Tax=Xanthomonas arboricola TaxID=56448 RepID=UPI00141A6C68|nr:YceI family protein [Xanthomonas arboricola]NIK52791.1 polyisoprenoid-binding protein YceI [Xanthomonas arboricola]
MTTLARLLLLPALVVTSLAATAAPVRYALDPVHTRVLFAVEHAGFSKALGTVSGTSGTLVFDPDDWASARLDVTVPLRRADLGDAKWNEATLARNLLDAERFPDAHFVSTQVEASGENHAKVTGNLTLHGVTRPVTLDVTLNALKRHPLPPFRRTAGFSATATLSRAEFGIDAWKSMIGDTVELRIEAEAVREGRAGDDAPQSQPQNAPTAPNAAPSPES